MNIRINKIIWAIVLAAGITMWSDSHKKKILQEIKLKKALDMVYDKYQWKSDRLAVYTDLVYNVNGGVIYEK